MAHVTAIGTHERAGHQHVIVVAHADLAADGLHQLVGRRLTSHGSTFGRRSLSWARGRHRQTLGDVVSMGRNFAGLGRRTAERRPRNPSAEVHCCGRYQEHQRQHCIQIDNLILVRFIVTPEFYGIIESVQVLIGEPRKQRAFPTRLLVFLFQQVQNRGYRLYDKKNQEKNETSKSTGGGGSLFFLSSGSAGNPTIHCPGTHYYATSF